MKKAKLVDGKYRMPVNPDYIDNTSMLGSGAKMEDATKAYEDILQHKQNMDYIEGFGTKAKQEGKAKGGDESQESVTVTMGDGSKIQKTKLEAKVDFMNKFRNDEKSKQYSDEQLIKMFEKYWENLK